MSTQYKKIQKKNTHTNPKAEKTNLKPKASRDLLLIILIVFTAVILVLAWPNMDVLGRSMYVCLSIGMVIVYVNRHANFSEKTHKILIYVSLFTLFSSVALLALSVYQQFF
ncbi:MAG: hypothetical protein K6C05_04810 [Anaerovibrio sp.]|uniref:hypothetical protein n=1 Tax=Anaerovibrio sp. TaxID=1872532 RepID=UPI0025CCCADA|nr:hypothetical protein [Anaerovibrio sp.]MCR5176150.1 hypothetical protein [Anaerovibrio sp.]